MFSEKNKLIIALSIFFFLSIIGSFFQAKYTYDPFHWGLVGQSALDLLDNKTPYKDIFIHYGFFSTLTQSLILFISKKDIIYLLYFSALFYSLANFVLCQIAYKFLSFRITLLIALIIFLVHPFANHPWYNYQFYLLLVLSLYIITFKNDLSFFFSGFFIALSTLVYENFLYLSFLILLLVTIINYKDKKKMFLFIVGYSIPIALFHLFLFNFGLHKYWIKTFTLNSAFLEIYDLNIFELFYTYAKTLLSKNIFTETYFYIFFIIFISNIYIILKLSSKFFYQKKLNFESQIFLYCTFISSLLFLSTLHNPTIFRFSTGPIIGIVPLLFLYENFNHKFKNLLLAFVLLILFSSSVLPIKSQNNKYFPLFSEIKENVNNKKFIFFKSQIWSQKNWAQLDIIDKTAKNVSKQCNSVSKFMNLTNDAYFYMVSNQYLKSEQYIYWYKNERYYNVLFAHFEKDIDEQLNEIIVKNDAIIFFNIRDKFFLAKNFDLKNFSIIETPYSYQQKRNAILIPNECYQKIKNIL